MTRSRPEGDADVARPASNLKHGDITGKVIGAAFEVHKFLGPGLLESVYEQCLCQELRLRNIGGIIIIDFIDMIKQEDKDTEA